MRNIDPSLSITVLLIFASSSAVFAEPQAAAPAAADESRIEVDVTAVTVAPATNEEAAETADEEAPAADGQAEEPAPASEEAGAPPAATNAPLAAAEIMRRPPSEWDALIEQKEAALRAQRQAAYPPRSPWADPYGQWMSSRIDAMERRMDAQYRQLQRQVDSQRHRVAPPWTSPGYAWSDYQRKLSRLQSLAEQERYERMMQQYMNRGPMMPPMGPGRWPR